MLFGCSSHFKRETWLGGSVFLGVYGRRWQRRRNRRRWLMVRRIRRGRFWRGHEVLYRHSCPPTRARLLCRGIGMRNDGIYGFSPQHSPVKSVSLRNHAYQQLSLISAPRRRTTAFIACNIDCSQRQPRSSNW